MLIKKKKCYTIYIKFCTTCGRAMMDNEYICRCRY